MSYPPSRYDGVSGEASARFHPFDAAPDFVYPNGTTVRYLPRAKAAEGSMGLYQWMTGAHRQAPSRTTTSIAPSPSRSTFSAARC